MIDNQAGTDIANAMLAEDLIAPPDDIMQGQMRQECQDWAKGWVSQAKQWREANIEPKWLAYQRAADSCYDPEAAQKKEKWQSKAFIPITASHRETIQAALFRTICGVRPMMEARARSEEVDDQSQNIRDLTLREMDRSQGEIELNKVFEDKTTYGDGYLRVRYEHKIEPRLKRELVPVINPEDPNSAAAALAGQPTGYKVSEKLVPTTVYKGVRIEHLSIWSVYWDPMSMELEDGPNAYRYRLSYGDIVKGIEDGYYLPQSASDLESAASREYKSQGEAQVDADRELGASNIKRPDYARMFDCYEVFAQVPRKWATMGKEQGDDLVASKIRIICDGAAETLLSVEPNNDYDGGCKVVHFRYMPVAGRYNGRGIPEMLEAIQSVVNETVNQRLDNVSLVINKGFACIEKALVNPNQDLVSKPGWFVRLKNTVSDVRQAIMPLDIPDVTISAYRDVIEMERYAQERTSANRVTIGTAGSIKDANQTLGGMEILKQSANDKFAYIGMLAELGPLKSMFRAIWKELYANIQPEDVVKALGLERAKTFKLISPEEFDQDYVIEPQGVYTMANKAMMQAKLQAMYQQFAGMPFVNPEAYHDKIAKYNDLEPKTLKLTPEEMQTKMLADAMMQGQIGAPLNPAQASAMGQGMPK